MYPTKWGLPAHLVLVPYSWVDRCKVTVLSCLAMGCSESQKTFPGPRVQNEKSQLQIILSPILNLGEVISVIGGFAISSFYL
jgi:hypothetical protein